MLLDVRDDVPLRPGIEAPFDSTVTSDLKRGLNFAVSVVQDNYRTAADCSK